MKKKTIFNFFSMSVNKLTLQFKILQFLPYFSRLETERERVYDFELEDVRREINR